jgi:uncharacterized protein (TIGR02145 family)
MVKIFMKHRFTDSLKFLVLFLGLALIVTSCEKDDNGEQSGATVTTVAASNIGQGWATINGSIKTDNKTCTVSFEYGTSTDYGSSVPGNPDVVTGDTTIWANLLGLDPETRYYFRLKAEFSGETKYGSDLSFTTTTASIFNIEFNNDLAYGSLTDIDGNTYKTIQIGDQTWMAENLKVTTYNDGTSIPYMPIFAVWSSLSSPAYCWYKSDSVGYGGLYNWYTVNDKLCPAGWHVPDDSEWATLINYLGAEAVAGGKLKETGTTHWNAPNYGATNESGFTALPAGYRSSGGGFNSIKHKGYWWTATESPSGEAYYVTLSYSVGNTDKSSTNKKYGFSVRCIKDN